MIHSDLFGAEPEALEVDNMRVKNNNSYSKTEASTIEIKIHSHSHT